MSLPSLRPHYPSRPIRVKVTRLIAPRQTILVMAAFELRWDVYMWSCESGTMECDKIRILSWKMLGDDLLLRQSLAEILSQPDDEIACFRHLRWKITGGGTELQLWASGSERGVPWGIHVARTWTSFCSINLPPLTVDLCQWPISYGGNAKSPIISQSSRYERSYYRLRRVDMLRPRIFESRMTHYYLTTRKITNNTSMEVDPPFMGVSVKIRYQKKPVQSKR